MLQNLLQNSLAALAEAAKNCQNHFNTWEFNGYKVTFVLMFGDKEDKLKKTYESLKDGQMSVDKGFSLEHNPPSNLVVWEGSTEDTQY